MFYKVVNKDKESAWAEGKAKVKYEEGKWVEPPQEFKDNGNFLFVFSELDGAAAYARCMDGIVYECEVEGEKPSPNWLAGCYLAVAKFEFEEEELRGSFPGGWHCFERVKITKEVK